MLDGAIVYSCSNFTSDGSSSGFRSSSVKFAFLVRTSTLNIGRGCIEVSLISTVPGFSVKSPPRCSCIAP